MVFQLLLSILRVHYSYLLQPAPCTTMPKRDPKELLVQAAVRALVPGGRLIEVSGTATQPVRENTCHYQANSVARKTAGATVATGWSLEAVRRHGVNEHYALFDYHSVVRFADGTLGCPSTPQGTTLRFVEDVARPFDMDQRIVHNLAVFSNHLIKGPRGTAVSPFTLTWAAPFGSRYLYSADAKCSKWVAFGWHDPFVFARERGLDPNRLEDMSFCSDIDTVAEAIGLELGVTADEDVLELVRQAQPRLVRPMPDVIA